MLKLICGPSGAGKTSAVINAIRADIEQGIRSFLLVPEQQAYISERDLPSLLPANAGLYFEIVNFSRLADDVFAEYGGVTNESVSAGVRSLLMWNTLRTLSPFLKQYGGASGNAAALCERMLQTVAELRSGGVDSETLENAAMQMDADAPLQKKLLDIALIDAAFHQKLEACFGSDPADKLLRMVEKLRIHPYFQDCHIYVDSFTDFTVPEYAVLLEIMKQAESVTVTLCTDSFSSQLPHFETTCETARRLSKLASRASVTVEKIVLSAIDSKKPSLLQALESNLWRFSEHQALPLPIEDTTDALRVYRCTNVYEEAEAAALRICELVQDGMHYGEIAVVVRDTETYRGVLDAALERRNIPYFLSERTDLSTKPICRLILSALRAVSRNYRQSDVITLFKTGLCGVDLCDGALFEEYCETWHINGNRFTDDVWSMNPDGLTTERSARAERILDAANRTRKKLIDPLQRLAADLRTSARLSDRCRALYDYLCRLHISEQLSERAKAELVAQNMRGAGESIRLWRLILDSLTTLCRLLPDEEMTVEEFTNALSLLFSNSDLGSVPTAQDCVVIGSASTLRVENIRASLVLGLCEGEFPQAVSDDGILTEGDKEALEAFDIIFDSRTQKRSGEELFYVYRAMTKPKESLSLFTVAQSTDGSSRAPSLAFTRVCALFEKEIQIPDPAQAHKLAEGKIRNETQDVPLQASPLPSDSVLRLSQSKIQAFVLCPYRYYSTYRLHLREKKDSAPTYADDGVFLHYVFEHFLRACLQEDGHLILPPVEETEPFADRIIDDYITSVCPFDVEHMDNRLLHLYAKLRKLSHLMLREILGEIRVSLFTPYRFEQGIGSGEANALPAPKLTLKNGATVLLSGKVDRVDLYDSGEKLYLRVVDYKSGKHTFSLDEVRSGMDIQLVLYLFAALSADPTATPAGAQYLFASSEKGKNEIKRSGFYLNEPAVIQAADGTEGGGYTKKLLPQSMEDLSSLQAQMQETVCQIAERILSGEAEKTPSEQACTFCPVRTNCNKAYHR